MQDETASAQEFRLEQQAATAPTRKVRHAWREKARAVIAEVVHYNRGHSRKDVRKALRAAYVRYQPSGDRAGYVYKAWCDEVAYALRERSRRPGSRPPARPLASGEVIPSARQWMIERGLLEFHAVLDVDLMDTDIDAPPAAAPYQLQS